MLVVEDFTRFLVGMTVALEGSVTRCPRCGRNGIAQSSPDGDSTFLHVQTSLILGDGMRTDPQDCCVVAREHNA